MRPRRREPPSQVHRGLAAAGRAARAALACLFSLLSTGALVGVAAAQDNLELAVKAAYLVKLGAFVDWPDDSFATKETPVSLCVVGDDPFGNLLERAAQGQRIEERPVEIRRLAAATRDARCHIMFTAGGTQQSVTDTLATVHGTPTLTITDAARSGSKGIVHFVIQGNKVRFEIDDRTAADNRLAVSSKILSLAVAVRPRSS